MTSFLRALSAELLKSKRTLVLGLAFLAPLSLAGLEIAAGLQGGQRMYPPGCDAWQTILEHELIMWDLLILPLFITLQMGLLAALEHGSKTWKQLYAMPLPRWTIYAAKQVSGLLVIGLSMVVMALLTPAAGLSLHLIKPEFGFAAPIPWGDIASSFALSWLAAGLIISIHLWVSLRWANFVLAMSVGVVATVAGVLIAKSEWSIYYPWTLSGVVNLGAADGLSSTIPLLLGCLGGLLVAILGGWDVCRQDVL